jgi:hypothetical protein
MQRTFRMINNPCLRLFTHIVARACERPQMISLHQIDDTSWVLWRLGEVSVNKWISFDDRKLDRENIFTFCGLSMPGPAILALKNCALYHLTSDRSRDENRSLSRFTVPQPPFYSFTRNFLDVRNRPQSRQIIWNRSKLSNANWLFQAGKQLDWNELRMIRERMICERMIRMTSVQARRRKKGVNICYMQIPPNKRERPKGCKNTLTNQNQSPKLFASYQKRRHRRDETRRDETKLLKKKSRMAITCKRRPGIDAQKLAWLFSWEPRSWKRRNPKSIWRKR